MPSTDLKIQIDAGFLALLTQHNIAVAATVGPDGLIVIGRDSTGQPAVEHRSISGAFALVVHGTRLAISHRQGITVYNDCRALAARHPAAPGRYDAYYTPLVTFHTGDCLVHDMATTRRGLVVANTRFSTVDLIDGQYNFQPIWRPPFVSATMPEDRCHLNGLALDGETLKYVTAFGPFDTATGWRGHNQFHGLLIDATTGRAVARELSLPHSPRIIDGQLYFCESGHGTLVRIDPKTGQQDVVCELPGLTRGLAAHASIAFVGMSMRRASGSFPKLPLSGREADPVGGVAAVELATGKLLGMARIVTPGREIFDLKLIPNCALPGIGERNDHQDAHLVASQAGAYWLRSHEPTSPPALSAAISLTDSTAASPEPK